MNGSWRTHQISVAGDEQDLLGREWLLTGGTGSYAMGTLPGVNTRRYHGLLVAATRPPVGRRVLLSQVIEQLVVSNAEGRQTIDFSSCCFRGDDGKQVYSPSGMALLRRFDRGTTVAWAYAWRHIQFVREVALHWSRPAVTVRYVVSGLLAGESALLRLEPMSPLRDFHHLGRKEAMGEAALTVHGEGDAVTLRAHDAAVTLTAPGCRWKAENNWWYGLYYPVEAARGLDFHEDICVAGVFEREVGPGTTEVVLTAMLGDQPAPVQAANTAEREQHLASIRAALAKRLPQDLEAQLPMLAIASDDFVVRRTVADRELSTILAGYPWFADWGRDTFIALPGLMLTTGRHAEARDTLKVYAEVIRDGLVPNRFDDYAGEGAHYNAVDASLWYIVAALRYMDVTDDEGSWGGWLQGAVGSIIEAYIRGAGPDIRMAGDGMIAAGNERTQLTWMDAKCDGVVFTPRQGKAVEINALWHHVLASMGERLKLSDARAAQHYRKLSERIRRAFVKVFWDDELGCLRDHVWISDDGNEHANRSIRPNQLLAASLPQSPIPRTRQRQLLSVVKQKLLTPVGLRTLPSDDRHYHGRYGGSPFQRDEAYHQGTIWPWLMGPYAEAVMRAGQFSAEAVAEARNCVNPLLAQMAEQSLGQLHEIHEADWPHRPAGCVAQAWSVGELLRVLELLRHGQGDKS